MASLIWITGLSGAGKTTLAKSVSSHFRKNNRQVLCLDGDELRTLLNVEEFSDNNHTREARLNLALRYSAMCKLITNQNITTIISTISMFQEVHSWNRKNIPGYIEVYLKVPISELKRRDPKNIYKAFAKGELKNIAGIDLPVDEPNNPDLLLEYKDGLALDWCVQKIMEFYWKI